MLGTWSAQAWGDGAAGLSFLGLCLTLDCNFSPRCAYCNQHWVAPTLTLDDWKGVIQGALPAGDSPKPYVYLTGGEPLLLAEDVWGKQGLISFAAQRRCAVNLNTNGTLITPEVALSLVRAGLSKIHISLDSPDRAVQDELWSEAGRYDQVITGVTNLQIARDLLQVDHPKIHINCVLTNRNLLHFPQLMDFLLQLKKTRSERFEGPIKQDPNFSDFLIHVIPVGGQNNAHLRPSKEEFVRFYTEVWEDADRVWQCYQETLGLAREDRVSLQQHGVFTNPFLRVRYRGTRDDYCGLAAMGVYSQLALGERCLVGPVQAFVLPDGSQYWCGGHAVSRPTPVGNVREGSAQENIARGLAELHTYPNEFCRSCAGATLAINQAAEDELGKLLDQWLVEACFTEEHHSREDHRSTEDS